MSDDASKFDPRFDPAFQRGYDGPAPSSSPRRPARRFRADSPPEPIGLPPQYSAVEQPRLPDRSVSIDRPVTTEERAPREASDLELDEAPRRRNPILAILTIIGVLLIAGSAALLMNLDALIQRTSTNGAYPNSYNLILVIQLGAPMLICLGLATLIGVLFIYAVRWKPAA